MLHYVYQLANANHEARKEALLAILRKIGVKHQIQSGTMNGVPVENIIVPLGNAHKRIVVGAHYDSVDGSTGANDNASGVSILLELIRRFRVTPPAASLDIVFFDHEEFHMLGSRLYVNTFIDDISAMINLDICGVGDTVLIAPQRNLSRGILADAVRKIDLETTPFQILEQLPAGDDHMFEEQGILNISVCILEEKDVQPMSVLFSGGKEVSKDDYPSIIETMHNGSRDSLEVVTQEALDKVLRFVYALIARLA